MAEPQRNGRLEAEAADEEEKEEEEEEEEEEGKGERNWREGNSFAFTRPLCSICVELNFHLTRTSTRK